MSSTFDPDINPNEFHEASKLININDIKAALKLRFRYEQISRLGNNHIIYPAFNEESFKKIIEIELAKFSIKTVDQFGLQLTYSSSFKSLIYNEGVFPTQGIRPVLSTVQQLVHAKIPQLIAEAVLNKIHANAIHFDFKEGHVNYEFFIDGKKVHHFNEVIQLAMEKLRQPTKNDLQAITAVHESGHAVISMKALKILPEYICSTTANVGSRGFIMMRNKLKYLPKENVVYEIAELLAGTVAESLIFGENKRTKGAEEDIERATRTATQAIKNYGMGSIKGSIHVADYNTKYNLLDNDGTYNKEVKNLLEEAYTVAEKILLSEKILLLQLADYLSDERIVKKEMIESITRRYGSIDLAKTVFIEDGNNLFYRSELKRQVKETIKSEIHSFQIPIET